MKLKKKVGVGLCIVFSLLLLVSGCGKVRSEGVKQEKISQAKIEKNVERKTSVDIVAFGDFMLHYPQLKSAKGPQGYDFSHNFIYLRNDFIEPADIAMINLETTLTDGSKGYSTFPVFSSPKEVARDFKEAGFDIISTANNHSYDKLGKGVEDTISYLEEADLDYIGTNKEISQPKIKEVNGIKIGFLSYTYGLNGFDQSLVNSDKPFAVNILSEEKIIEDTEYLREQKVDAMVAFVHWGEEYTTSPTESQKHYFEVLSDNGVILTLGSHPHVSQGVDARKVKDREAYVAYSMGNFVSNQRREYMNTSRTEWGLMVRARLEKDEEGKTSVVGFQPSPIYVDFFYDGAKNQYEVIPVESVLNGDISLERLETIRPRLEESYKNFRDLIPEEMVLTM